jgi:hypothetical protein
VIVLGANTIWRATLNNATHDLGPAIFHQNYNILPKDTGASLVAVTVSVRVLSIPIGNPFIENPVLYQFEHISAEGEGSTQWMAADYFELLRRYEVWDYSW